MSLALSYSKCFIGVEERFPITASRTAGTLILSTVRDSYVKWVVSVCEVQTHIFRATDLMMKRMPSNRRELVKVCVCIFVSLIA